MAELYQVPTGSTHEEQPEPALSHRRHDEQDEDMEKTFSRERPLDVLLSPAALRTEGRNRVYDEADFDSHRHSSLHIHQTLSHYTDRSHHRRPRRANRSAARERLTCAATTPTIFEHSENTETRLAVDDSEEEELQTINEPKTEVLFSIGDYDIQDEEQDEAMDDAEPADDDDGSEQLNESRSHRNEPHNPSLRERRRVGSLTEQQDGALLRVPTDEIEAKTLGHAQLDDMKSHRFEDVPGVRRHLVKKYLKSRIAHLSPDFSPKKHADHRPHEVFVELNELIMDADKQELQWRETARWIKFEEDVETETDRWGKPHVASLTFRSLLELRKALAHGTVLLDLKQSTLSGIAHQVVEQMIIEDQITESDRAKVLRALLLKHRHPNDDKEAGGHFFPRTLSATNLGSLLGPGSSHPSQNNTAEPCVTDPLVGEVSVEIGDARHEGVEKDGSVPISDGHYNKSRGDLKLLEKIPFGAEATVVLVGCVEFLDSPVMSFVRLGEGVLLESVLEVPVPVRFLFIMLGPSGSTLDYHEIGRSISTLMSDKDFHDSAYLADERQDLLAAITLFLDCSIVIPPSEVSNEGLLGSLATFQKEMLQKRRLEDEIKQMKKTSTENKIAPLWSGKKLPADAKPEADPLQRTHRPFGGLVEDVRRRYPKYVSDLQDALNPQCLAAVIFIYFAALSPAITFGGLLGEKTNGLIGVSELIIATSIQSILFSLLCAQPLLIIGFTGPLLVFEEAYYKFCQQQHVEYLPGRVWIGLWLIVIVLFTVAFEGSLLVRYISRFTQEIFAILISLIFIYETFSKIIMVFNTHPLLESYCTNDSFSNLTTNGTTPVMSPQPNTALLSLVHMLGTFFLAFFLRKFKNSNFLGGKARRVIGDFGVPIAILIMVLVDYMIPYTYIQKLNVPNGLSVTSPEKRGWLINPLGSNGSFPVWLMFASVIPAFLVYILIFMESQITTLIVNKKERRLVKGSGFHLDLLLIVTMGGLSAFFGMPWLSAATVRSVTHVNALTVMSKATAPGEKPQIACVKEQRLTSFVIAILIGLSVVLAPVLKQIPLAVLFGIFLYMGVTSLSGIQLYDRLMFMFMPAKHHPDTPYTNKVKILHMNLFTGIQCVCLIMLWTVMRTVAALAFPFMLILTVPLRQFVLSKLFSERELKCLDADDSAPNFDESEGKDEYAEVMMPV
uniref:anion exchange protein 2-like isoform X2 n=1 Tax=Myxine glutinosa TaxID=7769 RepID=UPI0035901A00